MGSGQGVHVINFAVRTAAIVIRRSVPARQAGIDKDRFSAGGNFQGIVIGWWRNSLRARKPGATGARIRIANRWRRWDIDPRLFMSAATCQQKGQQGNRDRARLRKTPSAYLRGG